MSTYRLVFKTIKTKIIKGDKVADSVNNISVDNPPLIDIKLVEGTVLFSAKRRMEEGADETKILPCITNYTVLNGIRIMLRIDLVTLQVTLRNGFKT